MLNPTLLRGTKNFLRRSDTSPIPRWLFFFVQEVKSSGTVAEFIVHVFLSVVQARLNESIYSRQAKPMNSATVSTVIHTPLLCAEVHHWRMRSTDETLILEAIFLDDPDGFAGVGFAHPEVQQPHGP